MDTIQNNPFALIIEDDQDVAGLFSHVLMSIGFETEIIRSANMAFSRLSKVTPDLVLLDLQLPFIQNGTGILRKIRGDARLSGINLIVITAYPHMLEDLEQQGEHVMHKPISIEALKTKVKHLMDVAA